MRRESTCSLKKTSSRCLHRRLEVQSLAGRPALVILSSDQAELKTPQPSGPNGRPIGETEA